VVELDVTGVDVDVVESVATVETSGIGPVGSVAAGLAPPTAGCTTAAAPAATAMTTETAARRPRY
jgi:hypothetical protein